MRNALDLINKIGEEEDSITERDFISPVFSDTIVMTKISGLSYFFSIPKTNPGWYKIRPISKDKARIVSEANLEDKDTYLKCLDRLRVVILFKHKEAHYAIVDKSNKFGIPFRDPIMVYLCDDTVMEFDRVFVRYDGSNFWFESIDSNNDPAKSDYLRESFQKFKNVVKFSGLTFEEKYGYSLRINLDKKYAEDRKIESLKEDVTHAGGVFKSFHERKDHYSVTFEVDGEDFTSQVTKDPMHKILAAGLCLNGNDRIFNLKSLITVVREAQDRNIVHKT